MHPADFDAPMPSVLQVPDEDFARAYDAAPDGYRAALKTCIAALHVLYGEPLLPRSETFALPRSGMAYARAERVAPWTLVVIDESFRSAPRLLAALMPALCAAVPDVRVIRLAPATTPWPDQLLVALELAGQEVAGSLDTVDIGRFVAGLREAGRGRLLCLGGAASFAVLCRAAIEADIPVWHDGGTPRVVIVEDEGVDAALVRWAHGAARMAAGDVHDDVAPSLAEMPAAGKYPPDAGATVFPVTGHACDAVFCGSASATLWATRARLVLTSSREGCWAFPDLTPDFFIERSLTIGRHVPATSFPPEMLHG
ncbi:hypothetical protein [Nitratidesulfovibrio vulgaris]|uniref:hypothetical protein n=1 Tax=Nitratidesulfovibrio vulgaris TaxID=881 RepID=UPI0023014543|nr:hypothetical protein [Nitratidesulfovibrio vulgaris]WCB45387.1 hypothetical protein PH214_09905 [Nitratidesulfovibrio vulgaris]